jgi:hypothetical protein
MVLVKSRPRQAALSPMLVVRARGEPVADDLLDSVIEQASTIKDAVVDEYLTGQLGITDHSHLGRADPDPNEIAIGRQGLKKSQGIAQ